MALTPEKREALKLARERIASCNATVICEALMTVAGDRPELRAACKELRSYIVRQLTPCLYLGAWQRRNGFYGRSLAQERRDRLAWIDWMLDEPKEA
jgi:hypothetical protein